MPRPGRRALAAVLVLLLAALVATVVFRSWVGAQARAVVVLSTTIETPVLTWAVAVVTAEPRVQETMVAGVPATLVRPPGDGPWPAVVFVNGATALGRHHPDVERLARGLARAGYLVLVPDPVGLERGEITLRTLAETVAVARAVSTREDARDHRVGFVGVSVGTTLALLAAEDPALSGRVSAVAGIAPYTDLRRVIRLATTGYYDHQRYDADPFVSLAVARSLAAGLPPGRDRRTLVAQLRAVDDDDPHPLAVLEAGSTSGLGRPARALLSLLRNRDPRRFDALYAALPASMRVGVTRLSPLAATERLWAPILLASGPHDKYFPLTESRALIRAAGHGQLTVTRTLDHAVPEPSFGDVADLFRFDAFVVRVLHSMR